MRQPLCFPITVPGNFPSINKNYTKQTWDANAFEKHKKISNKNLFWVLKQIYNFFGNF